MYDAICFNLFNNIPLYSFVVDKRDSSWTEIFIMSPVFSILMSSITATIVTIVLIWFFGKKAHVRMFGYPFRHICNCTLSTSILSLPYILSLQWCIRQSRNHLANPHCLKNLLVQSFRQICLLYVMLPSLLN